MIILYDHPIFLTLGAIKTGPIAKNLCGETHVVTIANQKSLEQCKKLRQGINHT